MENFKHCNEPNCNCRYTNNRDEFSDGEEIKPYRKHYQSVEPYQDNIYTEESYPPREQCMPPPREQCMPQHREPCIPPREQCMPQHRESCMSPPREQCIPQHIRNFGKSFIPPPTDQHNCCHNENFIPPNEMPDSEYSFDGEQNNYGPDYEYNLKDAIQMNKVNVEYNQRNFDEPICEKFIITDEYLLDYLLKKYKLDKNKLVLLIKKNKETEFKNLTIKDFYKQHKKIKHKPIKEQYTVLKRWNSSGLPVSKEELEDYHEKYIK